VSRAARLGLAAGLLLLVAPAAGRGQEPQGPERLETSLAGVLFDHAAREGSLGSILGDRHFRIRSPDGRGVVVRVRIREAEDEAAALAVEVTTISVGTDPPRSSVTHVMIGLDGRTRAFRSRTHARGQVLDREARVAGDELVVETWAGGAREEAERRIVAWHPAAVPGPIALFVLPPLYGEGLPDRLEFLQHDEIGLRMGRRLLVRRTLEPPSGPPVRVVSITHPDDPEAVQARIRVDASGRILDMTRGEGGPVMRAIGAAEADRLLAAEKARLDALREELESGGGGGGDADSGRDDDGER